MFVYSMRLSNTIPNDKENETPLKSTSSSLSKSREREKEKGQEVPCSIPQTKWTRKVSPADTISRISPHLSALGLGRLEEPYRCLRAEHTSLVFFFARARPPRETSSFNGKKLKRRDSPRFHFFWLLKFNKILLDEKKGVGVVPQRGERSWVLRSRT